MNIHGNPKLLDEFEQELNALSVEHQRHLLVANSIDAGSSNVISVVLGASIALLTQAIVAYLNKKKGQRKIVIQFIDSNDMLQRIEVETPRVEEVDKLIEKARSIFIVEEDKNV